MVKLSGGSGKKKAAPAKPARPEVAIEFDSSRGFMVKTPGHTIQCTYLVRTMAFVGTFFQVEVKGVVPADRRRKLKAAGAIAAQDLGRVIVKALKSHGCKEKIEIFTHNKEIRLR
jgi:hypothetical protein